MANGFIVTKDDWEHMTPAQQGWMTFNAVQDMNKRVECLENRPIVDKCFAFAGGIIGGAFAALGIKWSA
jgi:hypothetical protein